MTTSTGFRRGLDERWNSPDLGIVSSRREMPWTVWDWQTAWKQACAGDF
jgi:hypothetical protein